VKKKGACGDRGFGPWERRHVLLEEARGQKQAERSRLGCRSVRLAPNSRVQLIATALMEMLKVDNGVSKYIKVNKGGRGKWVRFKMPVK
jgi:hypothetical protein